MKSGIGFFILLLSGVLLAAGVATLVLYSAGQDTGTIPVSDVAQLVKDDQVTSIDISGDTGTVTTRQRQIFASAPGNRAISRSFSRASASHPKSSDRSATAFQVHPGSASCSRWVEHSCRWCCSVAWSCL
jgi:hypothetical protein